LSAYKIAIVGAGPAGYVTAQAFQNAQTDELTFSIDMSDAASCPVGISKKWSYSRSSKDKGRN
jgi:ferredoxin--NADP+ reductase